MYNTKQSKKGFKSKLYTITTDDMYTLLNNTKGVDQVIVILACFMGLRAGEIIHSNKNWLHVKDSESKYHKVDHIAIPEAGTMRCDCIECRKRAYKDLLKEIYGKNHSKKWHAKKQKRFYKLNTSGKIDKIFEKHKVVPMWRPKTPAGSRGIPFIEKKTIPILIDFFNSEQKVSFSRIYSWNRLQKLGWKHLDKKISAHSLRASFATMLRNHGVNIFAIKTTLGHSGIEVTDRYVESGKETAMSSIKQAYKL